VLLTSRDVTCIFDHSESMGSFKIATYSELGSLLLQIRAVGEKMGVEEPEPFATPLHISWRLL
jgi:hypothetical protein